MGTGRTWSMTILGAPAVLHDNTITGTSSDTVLVMIVTDSEVILGLSTICIVLLCHKQTNLNKLV